MKSRLISLILALLMLGIYACGSGGIDNGVGSSIDTQNQQSSFHDGRDGSLTHPIPE